MLFSHYLKCPANGPFRLCQMGAEIFAEFRGQQFQTELGIAEIFSVQRHPRCFAFGPHRVFEIVLNSTLIRQLNGNFYGTKNYVPRKVCWPYVSRFLILKGTVRCWAWRRPYPVDEAARHLYRPKHSASSYSRPYVLCCSSSIFIELRDTINWSLIRTMNILFLNRKRRRWLCIWSARRSCVSCSVCIVTCYRCSQEPIQKELWSNVIWSKYLSRNDM